MRRLSRILVAVGGAMSLACSAEPTAAPTLGPKPSLGVPDPKLIKMSNIAHAYLKNLNDGIAGTTLSSAARDERRRHVAEFIKLADAAIATPLRAQLRIAPDSARLDDLADEIPTPESGETFPWPIFVDAGTFTDLCLACQTATGFVQTNYVGLLKASTNATINVGGATFNPSSGESMCLGTNCLSQIDLRSIVDCHQRPASGTASSVAIFIVKLSFYNMDLGSKNTYASGECVPPVPPTVTFGSSSISVGNTTRATSNCVGYVQWSSGKPSVASVDAYGGVTGVGAGTAEIAATCNGMRGSAVIEVHLAEEPTSSDSCDDVMTPGVETCDDQSTQSPERYSVTYTRPGTPGEADPAWFGLKMTLVYKVVCDVTDWYEWNADHTEAYYVGTVIDSCWLVPLSGSDE